MRLDSLKPEQALAMLDRIDPKFRPVWDGRPPQGQAALVLYFLPAPFLIVLALTENPIILYPLAILSTVGILFLLTGVYTALLLMVLRRMAEHLCITRSI